MSDDRGYFFWRSKEAPAASCDPQMQYEMRFFSAVLAFITTFVTCYIILWILRKIFK